MARQPVNPSVLCWCNCGRQVPRATQTAKGLIKGEYTRYLKGHGPKSRVPLEVRFEAKVDRSPGQGPDGTCHLCIDVPDRKGYGQIYYEGRVLRLHRVAWFLAYGVWPTLSVLHRCDTPLCQNPDHLFEGTQADNMRDMALKDRCPRAHPWGRGEKAHNAKLTEVDVREIRALRGIKTQKQLASSYGVAPSLISHIHSRKAWVWLP